MGFRTTNSWPSSASISVEGTRCQRSASSLRHATGLCSSAKNRGRWSATQHIKGGFVLLLRTREELEERMKRRYPRLSAKVVRTGATDDVSYYVAETLLELVQNRHHLDPARPAIHIGFTGGRSLRKSARILADMLKARATGYSP
jgi:hypothetical protein